MADTGGLVTVGTGGAILLIDGAFGGLGRAAGAEVGPPLAGGGESLATSMGEKDTESKSFTRSR
ncbi:MAG: hypothetical protein H8E94_08325 [Alphaproteobacteria bacterium]|nr:hypothetical protein [Alphaproteobacteria bacterium]